MSDFGGHKSAMLERPRALFAWLGRRLFDHVNVDEQQAVTLRALPEQGLPVYIMRTRSLLDYLFFNHLFLKAGLPLARFANGVNLSFFRGLGEFFSDRWKRLGKDQRPDPPEALERTIRRGDSALIFMKKVALTAERQVSPGYFERLVELQRQMERPILLIPQIIAWPRNPPSKRRTWFDVAFGAREASGRFRKLGHFFLYRHLASVQIGAPIDLKQVLEEHEGWSDARVARKVRRVLFIHLAREDMAIRGPKVKPPAMIRREILERKRFRKELREEADRLGLSHGKALEKARGYLKEIAAQTSFEVVVAWGLFLDIVFNRVFQGVEVDAEGMRRVKEAAKLSRSAPLVLLPSHKSHADYLVISWVFLRNEFIPPHIAAGANLNIFPVGSLLRRGGAFFLRRSFTGETIYKLVFRRYLWKLVREGYPIEFYPEGGRSRTGKLLPPKLGMLSMLLEGQRRGEFKDLQFVPTNLSYERVIETGGYQRELTGGKKRTETMGGVMRGGSKVLRSRYGRVYVSFEEPVRLSEYLEKRGLGPLADLDEDTLRSETQRLGYHLMRQIQEATTVSPSALIGAVLLSHEKRGMSGSRLRERVGFLVDMLQRRQARLSRSVDHTLAFHAEYIDDAIQKGPIEAHRARGEALRPLLDEALGLLKRLVQRTERAGETIYMVDEKGRIELDYYRNAILGILAPEAFVATALRAAEQALPKEQLAKQVRRLSYWFRLEFIYRNDIDYEQSLDVTLEHLVEEGLVRIDEEGLCHAEAPRTLDFLRGTLLHLVEGYWIAADALRGLSHRPMDKKDWMEHAREHCEREFLEGDIRRSEAASTAILGNALELFCQEGLVISEKRGSGRRKSIELRLQASLEDVAFRRDDLGVYLVTRKEEAPSPPEKPPIHLVGE